ncbi:MAG: membrane protein insertion efficiency factor YidD [Alphaproteobacteria bacterium]|jgi:hypothetical protein|nr:membrane protein insertion efficiency factor YidD [Alphaproteobacteria bacterium]
MRYLILVPIRFYQWTTPFVLPATCRFYPSCSEYMHQAASRFGAAYGLYLGVKRILRCHPWHPGGIDPVPDQ